MENSLLCINDLDQLYIEGNREDYTKDFSIFSIVAVKCFGRPTCERNDKKYEDFLKSYVFELNYVSDKINFKKYNSKPVDKVRTPMDWI